MNPKGAFPALRRALFNTVIIPAKMGAEADVPSSRISPWTLQIMCLLTNSNYFGSKNDLQIVPNGDCISISATGLVEIVAWWHNSAGVLQVAVYRPILIAWTRSDIREPSTSYFVSASALISFRTY
jgi:hypothetical protein